MEETNATLFKTPLVSSGGRDFLVLIETSDKTIPSLLLDVGNGKVVCHIGKEDFQKPTNRILEAMFDFRQSSEAEMLININEYECEWLNKRKQVEQTDDEIAEEISGMMAKRQTTRLFAKTGHSCDERKNAESV